MKNSEDIRQDVLPALVALLRAGDHGAFEALHAHYRASIEQFLYSLLCDRHQAEDAAQEIFIRIWERREMLDPSKSFKSYLFVAAHHTVMNIFGRSKVTQKAIDAFSASMDGACERAQEERLIAMETALLVKLAVERMSPIRRAVFRMSYYEELNNDEIAFRLAISKANVANHLSQARKFLKEILMAVVLF